MTLRALVLCIPALSTVTLAVLQQRRMLHLLQLEHYENARLFLWLKRRRESVRLPWSPIRVALAVVLALPGLPFAGVDIGAVALLVATSGVEISGHLLRAEIKPLVYTERAKRNLVVSLSPTLLILILTIALAALGSRWGAAICLLLLVALTFVPAVPTATANRALRPWQRRVNDRFISTARAKLRSVAPTVVGVTGSYGKTTTKMCIGTVLSQREATLVTPASFNSYLGVVRAINENLMPEHRNFVVEMGMYRSGDIAELCELTQPTIGVITAIGPAHLERLGSIEAIQDAKAELALSLPAQGQLVTNGDDPRCVEIAGRVALHTTLYGIANPKAHVRAENLRMVEGNTLFELVIGEDRVEVETSLLGEHNVSNLLAAAAVGWLSGVNLARIKRGLEAVEPPDHRLQPIRNAAAGIVVIDDAYNSNPRGAAAALKVLRDHPAKRRILVTPGMVELGEIEEAENEAFGRLAAEACDYVILVGPRRTVPIRRGLTTEGFDGGAIEVVRNIGEATAALGRLTRAGDVVLFENDLPDLYSETLELTDRVALPGDTSQSSLYV